MIAICYKFMLVNMQQVIHLVSHTIQLMLYSLIESSDKKIR